MVLARIHLAHILPGEDELGERQFLWQRPRSWRLLWRSGKTASGNGKDVSGPWVRPIRTRGALRDLRSVLRFFAVHRAEQFQEPVLDRRNFGASGAKLRVKSIVAVGVLQSEGSRPAMEQSIHDALGSQHPRRGLGLSSGRPRQDVLQKVSRVYVADQQFLGDFGLRRQLQNCSAQGLMRA